MLESLSCIPLCYISLEQALTDIVESISREETALANIINSESEVIQKTTNVFDHVENFVSLNRSANDIIKNVLRLQVLLQLKLEDALGFLHNIEVCDEFEE